METNNWTSFSTREPFLLPSSTSKLLNLYKLIHKTFFVLRIFEDGDRTRPYGIARDGDVTWDGDVTRDGDSRWWRHWSFRHGTVWYWSEITFIRFFSLNSMSYFSQNFHPSWPQNSKKKFWKKLPLGPLRSKNFFFRFFRSSSVQNGRFQQIFQKNFFEPKGHFSVIFSKKFLVHVN